MQVQPYLFFEGRCEEAIEFYQRALGAKVEMMMRIKESPEPPQPGMCPPGSENKIMHAAVRIGDTTVMASDGRCQGKPSFQGFSLSLNAKDEAEAEAITKALEETNWNRKQAAALLKISYKALLYKIRQYGIAQAKSHHKLSAGA